MLPGSSNSLFKFDHIYKTRLQHYFHQVIWMGSTIDEFLFLVIFIHLNFDQYLSIKMCLNFLHVVKYNNALPVKCINQKVEVTLYKCVLKRSWKPILYKIKYNWSGTKTNRKNEMTNMKKTALRFWFSWLISSTSIFGRFDDVRDRKSAGLFCRWKKK